MDSPKPSFTWPATPGADRVHVETGIAFSSRPASILRDCTTAGIGGVRLPAPTPETRAGHRRMLRAMSTVFLGWVLMALGITAWLT